MFHGLSNEFLYSAYKIIPTFSDEIGNIECGIGTCFFVMNKNHVLCLVTNRHVLDFSYKKSDPELRKYTLRKIDISGKLGRTGDKYPESDLSFSLVSSAIKFHSNPQNDVACITHFVISSEQNVRIDYFIPYSFIATSSDFQDNLSVCDFLAFPGFPEWHDKSGRRPILRTGAISSDPRFDYSYKDDVEGACLAYEAFSFSGSSGSPVFAVQKGLKPGPGIKFSGFRDLCLIGINAGHLKGSEKIHSGISYLYKSTAILEIIDGS